MGAEGVGYSEMVIAKLLPSALVVTAPGAGALTASELGLKASDGGTVSVITTLNAVASLAAAWVISSV